MEFITNDTPPGIRVGTQLCLEGKNELDRIRTSFPSDGIDSYGSRVKEDPVEYRKRRVERFWSERTIRGVYGAWITFDGEKWINLSRCNRYYLKAPMQLAGPSTTPELIKEFPIAC